MIDRIPPTGKIDRRDFGLPESAARDRRHHGGQRRAYHYRNGDRPSPDDLTNDSSPVCSARNHLAQRPRCRLRHRGASSPPAPPSRSPRSPVATSPSGTNSPALRGGGRGRDSSPRFRIPPAGGLRRGKEVRKGEVLLEIDPRPYQADLERAEAELERARTGAALAAREWSEPSVW